MSKLSLMDQAFYKLESGGMSPVLMAGAMVLDVAASPYPMDAKTVADHLAARMEKVPLMRKKLVQDALKIGHMRLVDDPSFNVRNHITRTVLPAPGGYRELTECLGEFSAQRLDLSRPLWHYEVIEGLEGGRVAIAMHLHHAIIDGIGAMEALSGIWDFEPVPGETPRKEAWQQDSEPTPFALLREALLENAERLYIKTPAFVLKNLAPLLGNLRKKMVVTLNPPAMGETRSRAAVPKVRRTSLNVSRLSPRRVVSYIELPLADVKALTRHFDCSINDLVILLNSCALEYYFTHIGEDIDFDLVAGMPINIRTAEDGATGNAVTVARLSLHNRVFDLEARLQAIVADTAAIKKKSKPGKKRGSAIDGKALMGLFSPIVLDALVFGVVNLNLTDRATLVNVAITNVPGIPRALYLAGARQVAIIPMAPTIDTVGLTVTVSSTESLLAMGYHGCGEAIRDADLFVAGARQAFYRLRELTRPLSKANSISKPEPKPKPKPEPKAKAKPNAKPKAKTKAKAKAKAKAKTKAKSPASTKARPKVR